MLQSIYLANVWLTTQQQLMPILEEVRSSHKMLLAKSKWTFLLPNMCFVRGKASLYNTKGREQSSKNSKIPFIRLNHQDSRNLEEILRQPNHFSFYNLLGTYIYRFESLGMSLMKGIPIWHRPRWEDSTCPRYQAPPHFGNVWNVWSFDSNALLVNSKSTQSFKSHDFQG